MDPRSLKKRLAWLAGCFAAGIGIGFIGLLFTGDTAWFLAVPACLAAGWLVVANPEACSPASERVGRRGRRAERSAGER